MSDGNTEQRELIHEDIDAERNRQDAKWGFPQYNSPMEWAAILSEECGECVKELNNFQLAGKRENFDKAMKEAIETAAVAVSIIEHAQSWIMK